MIQFAEAPLQARIGELARSMRGNLLVDAHGRTARVAVVPPTWTLNPFGSDLTAAIVKVHQIGPLRCFDIRMSGTSNGVADTPTIRWAETPGNVAAVQNDVHDHSCFLTLVQGDFTNVTSLLLHSDHFDVTPAYVGGNYDGTNRLSIVSPGLPVHKAQIVRAAVTVTTAATAWINSYLTFTCSLGVAVDFTVRLAMPRVAVS